MSLPGVYAALVTALGFKPSVASEKTPGGFDSHPLPLVVRRCNVIAAASVSSGNSPSCQARRGTTRVVYRSFDFDGV